MSDAIRRNRNQVFSRFLPGSVMSIDGETVEVRRHYVVGAAGDPSSEAYLRRLLVAELEHWRFRDTAYRSLRNDPDTSHFELVRTEKVQAHPVHLYECKSCHAVQEAGNGVERGRCRRCRAELRVLPFLLIHTCGKMKPMRVPECKTHKREFMKLDRYGKQRWACGLCGYTENAFSESCGKGCELVLVGAHLEKADKRLRRRNVSDPGVHNAQILTLLNPPGRGISEVLKDFPAQATALFLASYLELLPPSAQDLNQVVQLLRDLAGLQNAPQVQDSQLEKALAGLDPELAARIRKAAQAELESQNPRLVQAKALKAALEEAAAALGPDGTEALEPGIHAMVRDHVLASRLNGSVALATLAAELQRATGPRAVYASRTQGAVNLCDKAGFEQVLYLPTLPIRSAAYGFSRVKSRPTDDVLLNAFPEIISNKGTAHHVRPVFIADANTEALFFSLDSRRIIAWLVLNDWLPHADAVALQSERERRAWLLRQQQALSFDTIPEKTTKLSWAIGACVHSVSHLLIGQIASQSSFGETSLSEMLFPATLSTVIYVNQRSEFSLGGLRTFLEQRLEVALRAMLEDEGCMLDPGCSDDGGACVGCLFIPEVSCRLLNNALSRHLLFSGQPTGELAVHFDKPITGFFSPEVGRLADKLLPT